MRLDQNASDPPSYENAKYFIRTVTDLRQPEDGIAGGGLGGIANDGTISCLTTDGLALYSAHSSTNGAVYSGISANDGEVLTHGPILDASRWLYHKHQASGESVFYLKRSNNQEILPDINQMADISISPGGITNSTTGTPAERLWIAGGNKVLLEKCNPENGGSRWHTPPSMDKGAIRLNGRGEAVTTDSLWRNGKYTSLESLLKTALPAQTGTSPTSVTDVTGVDLSSNGIILLKAEINEKTTTGILLPLEVKDIKGKGPKTTKCYIQSVNLRINNTTP